MEVVGRRRKPPAAPLESSGAVDGRRQSMLYCTCHRQKTKDQKSATAYLSGMRHRIAKYSGNIAHMQAKNSGMSAFALASRAQHSTCDTASSVRNAQRRNSVAGMHSHTAEARAGTKALNTFKCDVEPLMRLESAHDAARAAGGASGGGDQVALNSELLSVRTVRAVCARTTPRSVHGPTVHPLAQQRHRRCQTSDQTVRV